MKRYSVKKILKQAVASVASFALVFSLAGVSAGTALAASSDTPAVELGPTIARDNVYAFYNGANAVFTDDSNPDVCVIYDNQGKELSLEGASISASSSHIDSGAARLVYDKAGKKGMCDISGAMLLDALYDEIAIGPAGYCAALLANKAGGTCTDPELIVFKIENGKAVKVRSFVKNGSYSSATLTVEGNTGRLEGSSWRLSLVEAGGTGKRVDAVYAFDVESGAYEEPQTDIIESNAQWAQMIHTVLPCGGNAIIFVPAFDEGDFTSEKEVLLEFEGQEKKKICTIKQGQTLSVLHGTCLVVVNTKGNPYEEQYGGDGNVFYTVKDREVTEFRDKFMYVAGTRLFYKTKADGVYTFQVLDMTGPDLGTFTVPADSRGNVKTATVASGDGSSRVFTVSNSKELLVYDPATDKTMKLASSFGNGADTGFELSYIEGSGGYMYLQESQHDATMNEDVYKGSIVSPDGTVTAVNQSKAPLKMLLASDLPLIYWASASSGSGAVDTLSIFNYQAGKMVKTMSLPAHWKSTNIVSSPLKGGYMVQMLVNDNGAISFEQRLFDSGFNPIEGVYDAVLVPGDGSFKYCHVRTADGWVTRTVDNADVKAGAYHLGMGKDKNPYAGQNAVTRTLPDGTVMQYVHDASGKVGAVDETGELVIPIEYDAYFDPAVNSPQFSRAAGAAGYILLKDAAGWHFVDIACLSEELEPVAKPAARSGVVYNGSTQQLVNENAAYTLTGASGKDAGEYVATATLKAGYCWSDGSVAPLKITCTIGRKPIAVPTGAQGLVHTGKDLVGVPASDAYTVENGSASEVGWHSATVTPTANYMWQDGSTGKKTVQFEIRVAVGPSSTDPNWKQDEKGYWYSKPDGTYPKACWEKINGTWYHFNDAGYMQTGWLADGGSWYLLGDDGAMRTGLATVGTATYYLDDSGAMRTGWQLVGGKWYYFEGSGAMHKGWLKDGPWYFLGDDGVMVTGWQKDAGYWYYLYPSGAMATGWAHDGSAWYYMWGSGAMATGWINDRGTWYYLEGSGAMATGWKMVDGYWYYLYPSGAMATGWVHDGNAWYYLYSSGAMASNTRVGSYWLGPDGSWDQSK